MVSMVAFQAVDPGSIPGHRSGLLDPLLLYLAWEAAISTVDSIFVVLATALGP